MTAPASFPATPDAASAPLTGAQRLLRACLLLMAAIALAGGTLQMSLGQPETTPRLDNVHRFLAGIYLGSGLIAGWAGLTIRRQGALPALIALTVALAAGGRLLSMARVGLPEPAPLWLAYLAAELLLPALMAAALWAQRRRRG
ncbi:DUF4345 family protein [Piscinibacter sakaiensis]|uniref:DUF4345 domain-containing protein n=1 Tax=Piscinibacter sakaiensis TaxID=1547922 RepID=A0A0K8P2C0_PISS1|nr:DUF4345 family protein [Piscinibacter sakaiensis]GAP36674.1 hypothetical protein ISF6_2514 [Piscinibacter sakaiensis]